MFIVTIVEYNDVVFLLKPHKFLMYWLQQKKNSLMFMEFQINCVDHTNNIYTKTYSQINNYMDIYIYIYIYIKILF